MKLTVFPKIPMTEAEIKNLKPFEEFTNEEGRVRVWKKPDGTPVWLELRKTGKEAGYIKLGKIQSK